MVQKRTVKWVLVVMAVLGILAVVGVSFLNWLMNKPLYVFGSVRTGENLSGPLDPPPQTDPTLWQVEPEVALRFDSIGEGKPILIVHGGPGIPYGAAWKGLESLTDRYKLYYYHQRGCGDSTRPFDRFEGHNFYENMLTLERTLGLGAQIADIERIRRILEQDKITLIGHSYGGFIAMLYAAEFPDRVDQLILVAPAGVLTPPDEDRDLFDLARARLDEAGQQKFDELLEEYFDFGNIFSKSDGYLVDIHNRMGRYLLNAMGYDESEISLGPRSGGWAVFAMYFSAGRAQDFRPALKEVKAPTLIIHGEDDAMSLPGARSYEPIPGCSFVLIGREEPERRAGHFIFDDCPTKFGQVVDEFLAE